MVDNASQFRMATIGQQPSVSRLVFFDHGLYNARRLEELNPGYLCETSVIFSKATKLGPSIFGSKTRIFSSSFRNSSCPAICGLVAPTAGCPPIKLSGCC